MKKGIIIVRTNNKGLNTETKYYKEGYIFKTVEQGFYSDDAYYTPDSSISEENYRLATEREIEYFNKGITNINDIPLENDWTSNFQIVVKGDLLEYMHFCKINSIHYNKNWIDCMKYYGVINNKALGYDKIQTKAKLFSSVEEFKKEYLKLKNNKNEKSNTNDQVRETATKSQPERTGNAIISSEIRQVTTRSRPVGNGISARISTTRFGEFKISSSAISI